MDNKLSELSKPVAWVKADRNLAENWSCTDPESVISTEGWHSDYNPTYSQEYVSALTQRIAELEAEITNIVDSHGETVAELRAKLATPVRLPCPVHLLPGLKFGKGVPTRSMLDALVRRAEYESEREAMTPEQKAEDDARIEAFKALLPRTPAPAVPNAVDYSDLDATSQDREVIEAIAECKGWNAWRAAILAQPVSSGYTLPEGWKLVPVEPTAEMINAALASGSLSIRTVYRVMLAAAPEEL